MQDLIIENVDIPVKTDNIFLKGSIYYSKNIPSRAPFIINLAGLLDHRESYFVKFFSEKFAKVGYYVLSYDYRAHGETKNQTGSRWDKMFIHIFLDINVVIDWIFKTQFNRLLKEEIILWGRSVGGAIILTQGFLNQKIKKLIALCTRYDYHTTMIKFPENLIEKVSPKYFLKKDPSNNKRIMIAHCKDDQRIPFENLLEIKEHLGLSDKNTVVFESGGHSFKGHRDELFEYSLNFLKKL
jgi:esterase/lipase